MCSSPASGEISSTALSTSTSPNNRPFTQLQRWPFACTTALHRSRKWHRSRRLYSIDNAVALLTLLLGTRIRAVSDTWVAMSHFCATDVHLKPSSSFVTTLRLKRHRRFTGVPDVPKNTCVLYSHRRFQSTRNTGGRRGYLELLSWFWARMRMLRELSKNIR